MPISTCTVRSCQAWFIPFLVICRIERYDIYFFQIRIVEQATWLIDFTASQTGGCECGCHAMHMEIRGQAQGLACISHFLWEVSCWNRLPALRLPGVYLSQPPICLQLWGDRCSHVWLYVVSGYPNSGSHTWETDTLLTEPFVQSCELFSMLTDFSQLLCAEILSWAL